MFDELYLKIIIYQGIKTLGVPPISFQKRCLMADAKPATAGSVAPSKPKNINNILMIVFMVLNLAVVSGGAYMVYISTIGWKAPMITEKQLSEESRIKSQKDTSGPVIYTMDKFTVNLGGEPKKTIRIEVNLEMLGSEGFEEVMDPDNRARARDQIIRLLGEKTYSDVETLQGKLFLKDKIAAEVNSLLAKAVVKDVFFTEFIAQ